MKEAQDEINIYYKIGDMVRLEKFKQWPGAEKKLADKMEKAINDNNNYINAINEWKEFWLKSTQAMRKEDLIQKKTIDITIRDLLESNQCLQILWKGHTVNIAPSVEMRKKMTKTGESWFTIEEVLIFKNKTINEDQLEKLITIKEQFNGCIKENENIEKIKVKAKERLLYKHNIDSTVEEKVNNIKSQAIELGWPEEQLTSIQGYFKYPLSEEYGLICHIGKNDTIGTVNKDYIEIIGPAPRNIVHKFLRRTRKNNC